MSAASANWLALKRTLSSQVESQRPTKRRKISTQDSKGHSAATLIPSSSKSNLSELSTSKKAPGGKWTNPDSKEDLIAMILSKDRAEEEAQITKFVAMDCEMVGVGPMGIESALARVTIVNYVGAVLIDDFVRPLETVTDYRTAVSGVRPEDMINAKSFSEVQRKVSDLIKDRFLVGHALNNDLQALLLSHPYNKTRDTARSRLFHRLVKTNRPALRKLVFYVFGIRIQEGEHSSVIDARAAMALYRMYRKEWEQNAKHSIEVVQPSTVISPSSIQNNEGGVSSQLIQPTILSISPSFKKQLTPEKARKAPNQAKPKIKTAKQGVSTGLAVVVTHRNTTSKTASSDNRPSSRIQVKTAPSSGLKRTRSKNQESGDDWWKTLS